MCPQNIALPKTRFIQTVAGKNCHTFLFKILSSNLVKLDTIASPWGRPQLNLPIWFFILIYKFRKLFSRQKSCTANYTCDIQPTNRFYEFEQDNSKALFSSFLPTKKMWLWFCLIPYLVRLAFHHLLRQYHVVDCAYLSADIWTSCKDRLQYRFPL